jgi:phosphatidate cytidylyltransferase
MTFLHALTSGAFWAYSIGAAVILAASWGLLFWQRRRGQAFDEFWQVLWSWVLWVGLSTVGILLGGEAFALVFALVALFACKEFARATGLYQDWLFTGLVYLLIVAVNLVAIWPGYDVFMASPIYAIALICLLPIACNQSEGMLQRVALAVMAFVYFGYFLAHLSLLGAASVEAVYDYLLFLLYGTATADLAGWLANRYLSRHPIAIRISPTTTWESAGASLAWAALWSFTLGWTLPSFTVIAMLLATVIVGIMGPLGDLVMRYIMRDLGLKPLADGGDYAPYLALGHLNRLIFAAPLFFRLVHWFDPGVIQRSAA